MKSVSGTSMLNSEIRRCRDEMHSLTEASDDEGDEEPGS